MATQPGSRARAPPGTAVTTRGHSSQAATACPRRGSSAKPSPPDTRCAPHAGSTPPALQPAGRAGSGSPLSPGCPLRAAEGMLAAGWGSNALPGQSNAAGSVPAVKVPSQMQLGTCPPCPRWQGVSQPGHSVPPPAGKGPCSGRVFPAKGQGQLCWEGTPRLFMVSPCCCREPGGQACL